MIMAFLRLVFVFFVFLLPMGLAAQTTVSSLKHEAFYPMGLGLDFGKINQNNLYLGAETAAGFGFGVVTYGFYFGGGFFGGKFIELGEKKAVKIIPGICLGWWNYFHELSWAEHDSRDNSDHYFGGPFFKFLVGKNKTNFNISSKANFGYRRNIVESTGRNDRNFACYPSVEVGVTWIY